MKITRYKRNGDKIINKLTYTISRSFECADYFTKYSNNKSDYDFNILAIDTHDKFFAKNPKLVNVIEKLGGVFKDKEIVFDSKHKAIFAFRVIRMTSSYFKDSLNILYDILEKSKLGIFNAIQLMELIGFAKNGKFYNYNLYNLNTFNVIKTNASKNIKRSVKNGYDDISYSIKRRGYYKRVFAKYIIKDNSVYDKVYNKGFMYNRGYSTNCLFSTESVNNLLKIVNKEQHYNFLKFCKKIDKRIITISKFKRYGTMFKAFQKLNDQIINDPMLNT